MSLMLLLGHFGIQCANLAEKWVRLGQFGIGELLRD